MSKNDLNKLSKVELEKKLSESRESLTNLRFQKVLQHLEYPQKINVVKKANSNKLCINRGIFQ